MNHHTALLVGYCVALAGWLGALWLFPALWPKRAAAGFPHPWRELAYAGLAVLLVLGIGQLYVRRWMLPAKGELGPLIDAVNQLLIFAPILALPVVRRQGLDTAWLPRERIWARVLVGLGLAALAILGFTLVRAGSDNWLDVWPRVYHPKNTSFLVQVLCEDIAIAIVFVRIRAAIGLAAAVLLAAGLFAAAHLPSMIAEGVTVAQSASLVLDAGLGVVVLLVVQRSADVWWFWCVHFAMDMMQYYAVTPA